MRIESAIPLAGARRESAVDTPTPHQLRLSFHHGVAPAADRPIFAWPGRYGLKLGLLGDRWHLASRFDGTFLADPAISQLDFYAQRDPPDAATIDVLIRRVLPRLAVATGALTVHGAALSLAGGAVLLLGQSGAGKSTLTAALAQAGWSIASDDLTILRPDAAGPMIHPGATGVCVWPDTRTALALNPARCVEMPGYDGKVRFEPEDAPPAEPVRLAALLFLDRVVGDAKPILTAMPVRDAVHGAAEQLIALDPTASKTAAAALLMRMMGQIPALKLTYPSDHAALPAVAALLATLV